MSFSILQYTNYTIIRFVFTPAVLCFEDNMHTSFSYTAMKLKFYIDSTEFSISIYSVYNMNEQYNIRLFIIQGQVISFVCDVTNKWLTDGWGWLPTY